MILHVAFEKNSSGAYVSEGQIFGFADLYNDTNLHKTCILASCLISVKSQATITVGTTQTHYEIKLSFTGEIEETLDIYLASAIFYGLDSTKCVSFTLGTSYLLKVPYSFTMNIYV